MTQPREVHLARAYSQGPITALTFLGGASYLLAGEDTHLAIYDLRVVHHVVRLPIFASQPIHGIRVLQGRVLIWGASRIAVISDDSLRRFVAGHGGNAPEIKTAMAPDWIYDVALSPFDAQAAVLVTAHNEVVPVQFDVVDGSPVLGSVVSPSRPMLYSANVKWVSGDCVLVAGGTVFGEIIMWKYHLTQRQPELIFVLAGHEGSIFGVHISDDLVCADGSTVRLLASCSDDRTVRIWDITDRQLETKLEHELSALRETGFGSSTAPGKVAGSKNTETDQVVAVAMGHVSRIWGVKFAPAAPDSVLPANALTLYSFGEDSTTIRWRLDMDKASLEDAGGSSNRLCGVLRNQTTYALHDGKHLWSHAITAEGEQILVATGGADSKISLLTHPLSLSSSTAETPVHDTTILDIQEFLSFCANPSELGPGREIVGRYDFISENKVLVTTSLGRLILGTYEKTLRWQEIKTDDAATMGVKNCYTMRRIGDGAAVLGATTGELYHYTETQGVTHIGSVPRKITNILLLTSRGDACSSSVEFLVHMHGVSDAQHFTVDWSTGTVLATADVRGIDPRFVALSAGKIKGDLLAMGSRWGWLSILKCGEEGFRPIIDLATKSYDAITSIVPLPGKGGGQAMSPYFLTTCRDSKCRIYEIVEDHEGVRLELRSETTSLFGTVIEGAWFTCDATPELILFGFKSKKMMVWNETRREEISTVECGGSHRTFTFAHHPTDSHNIRFGFTKVSQLIIYSQRGVSHRTLRQGTHGREIRSLSYNGRYIATASEDTLVRIWDHEDFQKGLAGEAQLRCLASMKMHISGLQQLQWLGEDYLLSSAGNEELFIWRVRRLDDTSYRGLGVVCEAVFNDKTKYGDLRIMSFDAHKVGSDGSIIITITLSNSSLKTYRYRPDGSFHLLAQMSYTGACITQVRHLGVNESGLSALTASTDGHLATWEARFDNAGIASHVLVHVAPLHQNSIKDLDLRATPEGFQVLTAGDDNGLGLITLRSLGEPEGGRYTVSSRGIVRKAHAAAINGVALIQRGEATFGVSVSNDQRVKVWRIETERMKLVADGYSGIADPSDVELMTSSDNIGDDGETDTTRQLRFVLAGVGAEIWTI